MSSGELPDWLPAGWTMRLKANDYGKKVKCFVDPATGRKFYSKAQVFQHLEKAKSDAIPEVPICSVDNAVNKANESLDWLPDGWTVEERTRNSGLSVGSKFKVFTDPKSGHKFYSKPEVSRYLTKISSSCSSTPPLNINAVNEIFSDVVEWKDTKETNESPEWLPHGWSVETKTKSSGKKCKVYIDPASGFKFYSKPQVSRYLEKINTGSSPQIVTTTGSSPQIVTTSSSPQIVTTTGSSPQIVTTTRSSPQIVTTGSANDLSLDQSTKSGPSLKPDVSQNCEMNKNKFDDNKLRGVNDLMNNGTFERVTDEKFPPGWVKEIRIRKTGDLKHKDQLYTDPVSGYIFRSKVDALRYLETGDIKMCKCKPMKRHIGDLNLMNNDISHDIDHSTEGRNFSKPEVSQDRKTNQSNISGDRSVIKQSESNDVVGKNPSEEIPPGWKMEYKTRKMANRIVKDPYYVDPISGYEFRSKPDVQRYLETGDINSCKIKPKKRDINDLMTNENISPSTAVEVKKSVTTRRRQFPGKIMDNTISPEVGRSQRRRKNVSDATMDLSSPTVDILKAIPAKISKPTDKYSMGEESINLSAANDIIFSVVNDILHEGEVSGNEHSREETQSSTKSKKKRVLTPPLRSSKRLAAVKLDKPPESSLGESSQDVARNGDELKANSSSHMSLNASDCKVPQQLQTQAKGEVADHTSISKDKISHNESNGSEINLVDQSVKENQPKEKVTEKLNDKSPLKEFAQNTLTSEEITSDVEQTKRKENGQQEDAPENQSEKQEAEKNNDDRPESKQSPIEYPYMEDPCFEFAFKTLTGAIPVEENLSFQDYFKQQADTSQNQNNGQVEQPEIAVPSFSPVKVASHSAATETPVPLQQLPPDINYPAPEDIGIPSFTNTSQQFGFGAGWQTNAK